MTAIAGFVEGASVFIGGDSAGVAGWDLEVRADRKVFRKGEFIFGFTSSFRMGQLLRYKLQPPAHPEGMDSFEYMATAFVDAVRQCLKDGGYAKRENETETGGTFLVGYRGRLFQVSGDYQIGEAADGYDAVGCGHQIAKGALYATQGREPHRRMLYVLSACERHSSGVRGPFHIEELTCGR